MLREQYQIQPFYILNPKNDIINLRDGLHEELSKLDTLITLGLSDDFLDYPKSTLYQYFSMLHTFILNIQHIIT